MCNPLCSFKLFNSLIPAKTDVIALSAGLWDENSCLTAIQTSSGCTAALLQKINHSVLDVFFA